jgi:hypothetical protein
VHLSRHDRLSAPHVSQPDDDIGGKWFTLTYYIFGGSLMASAYGAFASVRLPSSPFPRFPLPHPFPASSALLKVVVENSRRIAANVRKEVHEEVRVGLVPPFTVM